MILATVSLVFELPNEYPSQQRPNVHLEFDGSVDNVDRRNLRDDLHRIVGQIEPGNEYIDEIVTNFRTSLDDYREPSIPNADNSIDISRVPSGKHDEIKMVLIWTHHLLSTQKRKFIRDRSNTLSLAGYSKPGYPGVIVVEGISKHVDLFIQELKELRWQALSVKADSTYQNTKLTPKDGLYELESMSDLTRELAKVGLEDWFLTGIGLRIGATT